MSDVPPTLFIPGPTEVPEATRQACARPMIGHREPECAALVGSIEAKLRELLSASGPVIVLAATGNGAMEASFRNLVAKRALIVDGGAWGQRAALVAGACGVPHDVLSVEPGKACRPEALEQALAAADYDAVHVTLNETATGVVNPLATLAPVVKADPERMLIVDAVSAMGAEIIDVDGLGLDMIYASPQKALAGPPGLSAVAISEAALARAETVPDRGWYFDLVNLAKGAAKQQTISTPPIPLMYGLEAALARVLSEGVEARYQRHLAMAELTRRWASERFALFAEEGHRSVTMTTVTNTRGVSIKDLIGRMRAEHGAVFGNGYGDFKEKTFRIGHMGEHTVERIGELLGWIDGLLE